MENMHILPTSGLPGFLSSTDEVLTDVCCGQGAVVRFFLSEVCQLVGRVPDEAR